MIGRRGGEYVEKGSLAGVGKALFRGCLCLENQESRIQCRRSHVIIIGRSTQAVIFCHPDLVRVTVRVAMTGH